MEQSGTERNGVLCLCFLKHHHPVCQNPETPFDLDRLCQYFLRDLMYGVSNDYLSSFRPIADLW